MNDRHSTPEVVGYCFVHHDGDSYVGGVSVQHDEFYGTRRATHYAAMMEAREIIAMLLREHVITESVCTCLPEHRDPKAGYRLST